ncbi:interferon alpha-inducible protein 27-like protein 1 [Lethenteron reissneri]|uniref:interferon alpha-inducible protein 27-like protein 1 n=1 Tax=Lethenteron reissneri TaxID=7753 RepID=UPI002AB763B0|nr:interferon alpha-inducible protein 27-like protein 1 [Lethenteron reissneri]
MTSQRIAVLFIAAILSVSLTPAIAKEDEWIDWCKIRAMAAGGMFAIAPTPVEIGAAGFDAGGIVASTLAAKPMSWAAAANGGGVAARGIVAGLQAIGAAGLGPARAAIAKVMADVSNLCRKKEEEGSKRAGGGEVSVERAALKGQR